MIFSTPPYFAVPATDHVENDGIDLLRMRRLGIDTYQEPVIYMRSDCHVCKSEGFGAQSRLQVRHGDKHVIATLNVITPSILEIDEAGLSKAAWHAWIFCPRPRTDSIKVDPVDFDLDQSNHSVVRVR